MTARGDNGVPRLHTDVRPVPDGYRVTLTGEFDLLTGPALADMVDATADGARHIGVDLAQVSFCDLAGLRMLLQAHRTAADRGVTLTVRNAPAHIVWLLHTTGTAERLLGRRLTADADLVPFPPPSTPSVTDPPAPAPSPADPGTPDAATDRAQPSTHDAQPADARDRTADERDRTADERDRDADERDRDADERDRLADDQELLDRERGRLLDERVARTQERQRWQDVREDLANLRDQELQHREQSD